MRFGGTKKVASSHGGLQPAHDLEPHYLQHEQIWGRGQRLRAAILKSVLRSCSTLRFFYSWLMEPCGCTAQYKRKSK